MNSNSKKNILIVEDDKVSSLLIKDLLEKSGYIVTSVYSGEEAIEKVVKEDFTPNLILMDIDLGRGIDGTQAAKEILKRKHIPVVFHTSHTEKEYVDKIKEITRYGYVVKNSGDFVLKASIDTAFELFEANQIIQKQRDELERSYEEAQAANDELISIQERLMQSEIRYKELFSNIKSGVAIYKANPDGSDFEFIDFNKAAEKMDGDKREDLLGKFLSEIRPGVKEFGLIEVLKRVWLTGIPEYLPVKVYKDGKINGYYDNYVYRLPSGEVVAVFDNLTDLRIAKEKAEENEEKFRFLFENMIQGVVYHNARGEIIEANKSSCEILGLSLEQMFGLTSFDPRWRAIREDGTEYKGYEHPSSITLKTGKPVLNVKMGIFNPKENKYRWININSIPKFRKNEIKPYQVIVTFEDITKLKEQQDELTISKLKTEESETRFKALHNASFGGIVIHDKGVILDCNMGLSKLTGYEYDELIGMDGLRLIAEESKELVLSNIYAGYEKPYEAFGIRKNGEKYPIRLEGKNIPYKNKIVRVTEFRDITEIKKAEKNLNETKELLMLFIKNSPIYTYIKKVTSEESRVVFASQNFIDMIGILGSDMTGKNMSELFPSEFADKMTKDDQLVVSKGEMLTLDEELDGKSYFTIKFLILLNGENFLAGYTIDITDRKNAEKIIQEQLK
nr:PAS domain S-box protein [Spirochaetota bacterium]